MGAWAHPPSAFADAGVPLRRTKASPRLRRTGGGNGETRFAFSHAPALPCPHAPMLPCFHALMRCSARNTVVSADRGRYDVAPAERFATRRGAKRLRSH